MKKTKLKTKIALYVLFIFFSIVPIVAWGSLAYFKAKLYRAIESQQASLVTVAAGELDEKLDQAQGALIKAAGTVTPDIASDPIQAKTFLRNRTTLNYLFENNLYLLTSTGKMVAEMAMAPSRTGEDFSFRKYVRKTISTGKPYISAPIQSLLPHHHPVIVFTAPVMRKDGTMHAILAGSIDLMRPNFLGRLATARVGKTGYFFIYNTDRTMILHPDSSRIMKNDVPPGVNHRFDLAIAEGNNSARITVWQRIPRPGNSASG